MSRISSLYRPTGIVVLSGDTLVKVAIQEGLDMAHDWDTEPSETQLQETGFSSSGECEPAGTHMRLNHLL